MSPGAAIHFAEWFILLQLHRNTLRAAWQWRLDWQTRPRSTILRRTAIERCRMEKDLPAFISNWIQENCIPSSNSKNTVMCVDFSGERQRHVVHWRTDSIENLFRRCRVTVNAKFGLRFQCTFFYKCIPKFVRRKKHQKGLCPLHHTGYILNKELLRKRGLWHKDCTCSCTYCSPNSCDHGRKPLNGM